MKIFDSEGFKYDSVNGCVVFESAVGTTSWVYTAIGYRTLWLVWVCVTWSRNLEICLCLKFQDLWESDL